MKKIVTVLTISVVLIFKCNTSKAQESGSKVEQLPAAITQQRIEPTYKVPEIKATSVKPNLSLQTKPVAPQQLVNTQQKEEDLITPVAIKTSIKPTADVNTIDTKTNTDKYYNQKPILPAEPSLQVNKQITKEKTKPKPVAVVAE